jgi:uncharacterized protein (DUF983 family)
MHHLLQREAAVREFFFTFVDTGLRLRCPVCDQGELFRDWFTMNRTCAHCSVRFERHEGEVTGGMSVSIVVTSLVFFVGYFLTEVLWDWPLAVHFALWVPFAILFPIGFYRHSRALWVACLYLTGDVYWDKEPYTETKLSILDAFINKNPEEPSSSDSSARSPRRRKVE